MPSKRRFSPKQQFGILLMFIGGFVGVLCLTLYVIESEHNESVKRLGGIARESDSLPACLAILVGGLFVLGGAGVYVSDQKG